MDNIIQLVICLLFVAGGVFILAAGDSPLLGWGTVLLAASCSLMNCWLILAEAPQIEIAFRNLSDDEIVDHYRKRFENGPVGYWYTSLGGGDISHGCNIQFNADGTGKAWHWGAEPFYPDGEYTFEWKPVGNCRIEISCEDPPEPTLKEVRFDFFVRRDEYEILEVWIFELDHWSLESFGECGFWHSGLPLVHQQDTPSRFEALRRRLFGS